MTQRVDQVYNSNNALKISKHIYQHHSFCHSSMGDSTGEKKRNVHVGNAQYFNNVSFPLSCKKNVKLYGNLLIWFSDG